MTTRTSTIKDGVAKSHAALPRERLRKAGYSRLGVAVNEVTESVFEYWSNGSGTLILHDMHEDGWDLYRPTSVSNNAEQTLHNAGI